MIYFENLPVVANRKVNFASHRKVQENDMNKSGSVQESIVRLYKPKFHEWENS